MDNQVVHDEHQVGDATVAHFEKVSSLDNFAVEFVFNMVQAEMQEINFSSKDEEDYNCSFSFRELQAVQSKTLNSLYLTRSWWDTKCLVKKTEYRAKKNCN